jgi:uncharacterized protein (TIGR03083 family)
MTVPMQSYVDAYEQTLRSLLGVVETLDPEQWARATDCPGWTVRDHVAHIVALERQLAGDGKPPAKRDGYGAHVRGKSARHMEDGVVSLRGLSMDQLVQALGEVLDRRLAVLRSAEIEADSMTTGVLGNEVPTGRFWPIRVFDVWAHEQDVRRAVGVPGNLSGPAAGVSRDQIALSLSFVVGQTVKPPAGTRVAFDVSGETPLLTTVEVDGDGQATASTNPGGVATTTLRTDFETLVRLSCGRVDPTTATVTIEGDEELGRQVLSHLAITP